MSKLSDLMLGPTIRKPFSFIRKTLEGDVKIEVLLRILTADQLDRARVNAERYVDALDRDKIAGRSREEILEDARVIEVLSEALRDPQVPDEPWAGPNVLRSLLTPIELGLLSKAYEEHQEAVGPMVNTMSPEMYENIIELVGKEGDTDYLLPLGRRSRESFIAISAQELRSLRMDRLSLISESEDPPSDG